jgi:hypothetical protein
MQRNSSERVMIIVTTLLLPKCNTVKTEKATIIVNKRTDADNVSMLAG